MICVGRNRRHGRTDKRTSEVDSVRVSLIINQQLHTLHTAAGGCLMQWRLTVAILKATHRHIDAESDN